jgi:Type III restriction enzyme, res subunit/Helicase conserved C-terminal domain
MVSQAIRATGGGSMIDVPVARQLLDFGKRIGQGQRADEQLEGAVAIHNILRRNGMAYLADEVGMGKTYVALGALALFRHFNPHFRVLVIAPRQNIQRKWMKEMRNFVANNVRFPDLRVKGIDGLPARELVFCDNLTGLVEETSLNSDRDFFARLTSFSLPVSGEDAGRSEEAARLRDELREHFPWLPREIFDLRDRQGFKDNVARAICCVLPVFDLVIVDEGHNLKHGFNDQVSARNRVLSLAFGHPAGAGDRRLFANYGPRARMVLFLSATPVEDTYLQLWNQLNVFGRGGGFEDLNRPEAEVNDDRKKELVSRFLVRRVTEIRVNGEQLTKNLYRREWRSGGVANHDEPIVVEDDRQRLIVALVQKKVSELLQDKRFGNSFQVGMLASFESFLETAKLKQGDDEDGNFDDRDQNKGCEDSLEKEGVDVKNVNRLAKSYRTKFGHEMPHPKMDAIIGRLAKAWKTGEKSLVFVRRVASVKELKRKLDESYNEWLLSRLRSELPQQVQYRLKRAIERYEKERVVALNRGTAELGKTVRGSNADDRGGTDTFFAWFLRGRTPLQILSGSLIRERYAMPQSPFFEDNYAAMVLNCIPGEVTAHLASVVGKDIGVVRDELRFRSRAFLRASKKLARGDRFESVQAAAIEWLKEVNGPHRQLANVVWHQRFEYGKPTSQATEAPDIDDWLECRTFFTELRKRPDLRQRIWPEPKADDLTQLFREREIRARMLAAAARLGHSFIDLYILTIRRLGSLRLRAEATGTDAPEGAALLQGIEDFLAVLEAQMNQPLAERNWAAFDELAEIGSRDDSGTNNFDLILDVNAPDVMTLPLAEVGRRFGTLLSSQQPTGGMAGQVNHTLVSQFRMPGYPFILISTDLLQEGEDLHTFCSSVHHYGISWTPSSMEQRIGRIDRVRSQTDRRLSGLSRGLNNEEKLQVYFPHLQDTIEVVQVQRLLTRMNTFLRLMHEGLILSGGDGRKIDLAREMVTERRVVPQILQLLKSAFAIKSEHLQGGGKALATTHLNAESALKRFLNLALAPLAGINVQWEAAVQPERLFGTVMMDRRQQPFTLLLRSFADRILVRCISPVGRVFLENHDNAVQASTANLSVRVGAILTEEDRTYDLTIEEDVILPDDEAADAARVAWLIHHVTATADQLEQTHLPGQDEPLATFKADLAKEMCREH